MFRRIAPVQRPAGRLPDRRGIGQDLLHPLVRIERLAVDDADRGEFAGQLDVIAGGGLRLDVLVDHLEETVVAGRDGVEGQARRLDEPGRGDLGLGCDAHAAVERVGDARPVAAGPVGIDLHRPLDVLDRGRGIVVHQVRPRGIEREIGLRMGNEIAAVGQRPVIIRADDQVLAAQPAVRARRADVDDPREPHVVDRADAARGLLDHHRPLAQVEAGQVIDRVGIRGQEQRIRVHQFREDHHVAGLGADAFEALHDGQRRGAAEAVVVDVERAGEVEHVVDTLRGLLGRDTVAELEPAGARVDPVGRRQRGDDVRGNLGGGRAKSEREGDTAEEYGAEHGSGSFRGSGTRDNWRSWPRYAAPFRQRQEHPTAEGPAVSPP